MARGKKAAKELAPEEKLQQALVPVEEQPYLIPENWCWTYLSCVAQWGSGGTPSRKILAYYDGEISWIKTGELNDELIYASEEHISSEAIANSSAKLFPIHTVIIAMYGATIGKVGILEIEAATNQACACAISSAAIDYKYLFYYAKSQKEAFIKKGKGGAQPNISQEIIKTHEIPLSPLPEQHRIVSRIESLFAKLDEAKEKAQDVVDGFELRKSAILHKAFMGELTERWRKEHGIGMESWVRAVLIDVLKEKPRNGYSPKPVNYVTPYKSMTLSATTSGVFKDEYFKYVDETIPEDSYLWLKPGDILIQRANSLDKVGTSAVYTGQEHEFIYPDLMMKLQVVETTSSQFVAYSLKRDDSLAYFRANATGTAGNMPKINQKVVSQTPLNLPTFDEQIEIVRILESLFVKVQQSKEAAEAVLSQIDTMKKAILACAFRGELGTNAPTEESAVELIKAVL